MRVFLRQLLAFVLGVSMAWISPQNIGTGQSKVSSSVVVLVTATVIFVGEVVVVIIASDNTSTVDGDNGEVLSVEDASGNTWTKAREFTNAQGAAGAGATVSVWFSKITTEIGSGTDITATFVSARTAKAITGTAQTVEAGSVVTVEAGASLANDGADPGSMNLTTPNAEFLWVRGTALERANATWTKTAAYGLNITNIGTTGGGAASNMNVCGEVDVFTGTTNPSDPTATAVDCASVLVALKEAAPVVDNLPAWNRRINPAVRDPMPGASYA